MSRQTSTGPRDRSGRPHRSVRTLVLLVLACAGVLVTAPAAVADVAPAGPAFVRAAHLVPDLPTMDIDLAPVQNGTTGPVGATISGAGYGDVSTYSPVPAGSYAVSIRPAGSQPGAAPVLTGTVKVEAGRAYTVAALGRAASGRIVPLEDDLTLPAPGHAKVRVLSAAGTASSIDVDAVGGPQVARAVAFGASTDYADVPAGHWTLRAAPAAVAGSTAGAGQATVQLAAGSTYTLSVTDGKGALTVTPVADAIGPAQTPMGGAATGAGGTAPRGPGAATRGALGALVSTGTAAVVLVALRRRGSVA